MIWGKLKRLRGTKYHNINVGCIITRFGIVYGQSGCGCLHGCQRQWIRCCQQRLLHSVAENEFFHMDAACGPRPLAQVLRNSPPGIRRRQPRHGDTIPNDISSQRRESTSGHRVSAYSMMLQLYVRQPGG